MSFELLHIFSSASKLERLDKKCNSAVFSTLGCKYQKQPGHGGWQDLDKLIG